MLLLQAKWTWGPDGQGAVLLVNCDRDSPGTGGPDSGQVDIRTTAGRVSSAAQGDPKDLTGVFPACNTSLPSLLSPLSIFFLTIDLQDMSVMLLRTQGPSAIFAEYQVVLHVPESNADKVRVFHAIREYFFLPSQIAVHDPEVGEPCFFLFTVARGWVPPITRNTHLSPKLLFCSRRWGYMGKIKGKRIKKPFLSGAAEILTFPLGR